MREINIKKDVGKWNCRHCRYWTDEEWCRRMFSSEEPYDEESLAYAIDYEGFHAGLRIVKPDEFFCAMWEGKE